MLSRRTLIKTAGVSAAGATVGRGTMVHAEETAMHSKYTGPFGELFTASTSFASSPARPSCSSWSSV